jgi:Txe/YoeB family toxin of Txe-Axe toxin-antitoxin module
MDSEKLPKVANKFVCSCCHYTTCKKSSYEKHIITDKHKKRENDSKMVENDSNLGEKVAHFICNCGKVYKYDSGYYRHKKVCQKINKNDIDTSDKDQLILMLIKQNSELIKETSDFKNIMMEVMKNGTHNTNTTTTNSHNKAFNLQFFLNETCKDAMNITDFVESIQLQLSDLEKVGEIGYVEGISNIIVKNLNALDVTQRPVHCTDKKRETIYIKDEDKWEKDEEKNKIRKVIKKVATKNARLIQKFKEKHPDYNEYHSKYSTQYHKLIIESLGGSGDNDLEKEDKIIRNIAKNIVVDK